MITIIELFTTMVSGLQEREMLYAYALCRSAGWMSHITKTPCKFVHSALLSGHGAPTSCLVHTKCQVLVDLNKALLV